MFKSVVEADFTNGCRFETGDRFQQCRFRKSFIVEPARMDADAENNALVCRCQFGGGEAGRQVVGRDDDLHDPLLSSLADNLRQPAGQRFVSEVTMGVDESGRHGFQLSAVDDQQKTGNYQLPTSFFEFFFKKYLSIWSLFVNQRW